MISLELTINHQASSKCIPYLAKMTTIKWWTSKSNSWPTIAKKVWTMGVKKTKAITTSTLVHQMIKQNAALELKRWMQSHQFLLCPFAKIRMPNLIQRAQPVCLRPLSHLQGDIRSRWLRKSQTRWTKSANHWHKCYQRLQQMQV